MLNITNNYQVAVKQIVLPILAFAVRWLNRIWQKGNLTIYEWFSTDIWWWWAWLIITEICTADKGKQTNIYGTHIHLIACGWWTLPLHFHRNIWSWNWRTSDQTNQLCPRSHPCSFNGKLPISIWVNTHRLLPFGSAVGQ